MLLPSSYLYTLSLHDALPILARWTYCAHFKYLFHSGFLGSLPSTVAQTLRHSSLDQERNGLSAHQTRSEEHTLNSSHGYISYAVFCLTKKIPNISCR